MAPYDFEIQYQAQTWVPPANGSGWSVAVDRWHQPWAMPVRTRTWAGLASQQFIAFVKAAPFPEAVFESKWHYAWSEPVRVKPGLAARYQWAFTSPEKVIPPPIPDIIGVLSATETLDILLFGGYAFNAAALGIVGVIEDVVPPTAALPVTATATVSLSIREI